MLKLLMIAMFFWGTVEPAGCATILDASGKTVPVDRPFSRIISLYGAHTENLLALGLDREILGAIRDEMSPEAASGRPVFSYTDDPEKLMAAGPDLVLIRPMISRSHQPFVEKLEKAGVTVVSLQPVGAEDMFGYWRDLGALTGRTAEAEAMVRRFQEAVASVRERLAAVPPERRKKVYFEAIHAKMKTFSRDSMSMFALETAGGVNVADDARQMRETNIAAYGKEQILAKADLIEVFLAQRGRMNPVTMSDILEEPGFHAIRAVREGRVYLIDEAIASRPTPRLMEGILEIARKLYPELFPDSP